VRFVAFLLMFSACQKDLGAVSVRWEIVDLTRGDYIKPNEVGQSDGSCAHQEPDMSPVSSWRIAKVRLVLAGADGNPLPNDQNRVFDCRAREAVTPFTQPLGTFAMSLRAVDDSGNDDRTVITPAPAVRTIRRGEVVNLDVVELGIHPQPLAPSFDMGPLDLAIPDGGPVM
jgi:hypothetical protein